ncbi:ATP-binding protein [Candidatus Woesearchaeota archaeon]|nr:ATP-binding protein [Candidatus Woesearchaeota archaeon]
MENNNNNNNIDGQIIGGDFTAIKVRQKSKTNFEIGELLICEVENKKIIYRIFDLSFSSQISDQNLELISGLNLEKDIDHNIIENDLRNYITADLQALIVIEGDGKSHVCKVMPSMFNYIRRVCENDFDFFSKESHYDSIKFGNLRTGSKELNVPIYLDGKDVYSHHILITATTGKGKSNLVKNLLFDSLDKTFVSNLVLDPHNEYFGATSLGLKDHNMAKTYLKFYSNNKVNYNINANSLKINLKLIQPLHLRGVITLSDAQWEAIQLIYSNYKENWINEIYHEDSIRAFLLKSKIQEDTYKVIVRKFTNLFSCYYKNDKLYSKGIFSIGEIEGLSFISDIVNHIENNNTIIIDTSSVASAVEILIGSLVVSEIFSKYKSYKMLGELDNKPLVNIILEEAPRVIGNEALKKGSNIFDTIAREGRKFKVGLTAITQLPSLIPKTILANMTTKIIMGTENHGERQAIVDSAAHDLSKDGRSIASLDRGEAILSSNFAKFAIPIKIPFIDTIIKQSKEKIEKEKTNIYTNHKIDEVKKSFSGIDLD